MHFTNKTIFKRPYAVFRGTDGKYAAAFSEKSEATECVTILQNILKEPHFIVDLRTVDFTRVQVEELDKFGNIMA